MKIQVLAIFENRYGFVLVLTNFTRDMVKTLNTLSNTIGYHMKSLPVFRGASCCSILSFQSRWSRLESQVWWGKTLG